MLDDTAELLRTRNYHVLTATGPEAALAAVRAEDCICSGLVVLIEADDAPLGAFLQAVRSEHPLLKVILRPMGREREDLRPALLQLADLVVSGLARDEEFLDQLHRVLQGD